MIELEKSKVDYENTLSASSDNNYGVHLKKSPDSCFVNDYFNGVKLAFDANMDIYVIYIYVCYIYIYIYICYIYIYIYIYIYCLLSIKKKKYRKNMSDLMPRVKH